MVASPRGDRRLWHGPAAGVARDLATPAVDAGDAVAPGDLLDRRGLRLRQTSGEPVSDEAVWKDADLRLEPQKRSGPG